MRGEVISPFRDKFHFNTIYEVGAVLDFDEERMNSLIERKLCKMLEVQNGNSSASPKDDKEIKDTPKKEVLKEKKESKPKKEKTTKKDATESTEETSEKENVEKELDEKAKSEQEAAKKIAEAMSQAQK